MEEQAKTILEAAQKKQAELDQQQKEIDEAKAAYQKKQDAELLEQKQKAEIENAKVKALEDEKKRAAKEAKDKEDAEKAAEAAKVRELALRPDKEKLQAYAAGLIAMAHPELKDDAAKEIFNDGSKKVKEAANYILNRLKNL